ncbi:hypothetical protein UP12_19480 (plasmid) [Bacillus pumilus]|uniref:hypothetical protein n=1 Tax=Bacillus pumilus TaxID=1408 RepID=UPI0007768155|nr:hypothetical protein [Bacillus pumilus]AMM99589.1 hypothetical protein UP12_19480 [Bacillus pumilus]
MDQKLTLKESIIKASITLGVLLPIGGIFVGLGLTLDSLGVTSHSSEKASQESWIAVLCVCSYIFLTLVLTYSFGNIRDVFEIAACIVYIGLAGLGGYYLYSIGQIIWCVSFGVVACFILFVWLYHSS